MDFIDVVCVPELPIQSAVPIIYADLLNYHRIQCEENCMHFSLHYMIYDVLSTHFNENLRLTNLGIKIIVHMNFRYF